jgi:hypothetical protein
MKEKACGEWREGAEKVSTQWKHVLRGFHVWEKGRGGGTNAAVKSEE